MISLLISVINCLYIAFTGRSFLVESSYMFGAIVCEIFFETFLITLLANYFQGWVK